VVHLLQRIRMRRVSDGCVFQPPPPSQTWAQLSPVRRDDLGVASGRWTVQTIRDAAPPAPARGNPEGSEGTSGSRVLYVQRSSSGIEVQDDDAPGTPVDDEVVRAIAVTQMAWPRVDVRALAAGASVPALAGAVQSLVAPVLSHAHEAKTDVTFVRASSGGADARLTVRASATSSDSAMCHHVETSVRLAGELRVSTRDGALLSLKLRGPWSDEEGRCSGSNQPVPRPCEEGEAMYEIDVTCPPRSTPGPCDGTP